MTLVEQEVTARRNVLRRELLAPRVKRNEVMHLSRQLSAFVQAGLPITDAVHMLGIEASNSSVRTMMRDVETGLRSGDQLSECVAAHPKIFPEFYRGILRSAELTGQLDTVLDQLAGYLERDVEARRKLRAAMIYPGMIAIMAMVTVTVLTTFVLPKFRDFFRSLNATLPLPTRMLLNLADFLGQWWWLLLGSLAGIGALGYLAARTRAGRIAWDRFVLRLPVVGDTVRFVFVERFCRILSSMVGAGVGLPEALRVATNSIRNREFRTALDGVGEAMLQGAGLAAPMAATRLFPTTAAMMFRVGEETGSLDAQLAVTARFYEGELDYRIKKLTALSEPLVIVVMGLIVGFVAVAMVSAMYGIFNQVHV